MEKITIGIDNLYHANDSPKCYLDLISLPQWQLVVARIQVQGTENLGLTKGIKDLLQ
jgi:hypothetical protein